MLPAQTFWGQHVGRERTLLMGVLASNDQGGFILAPWEMLGEGESSNVYISYKSKQWARRARELGGVSTYLLPHIFSDCVIHSLAKKFIMLPIVQRNP